MLLLILIVVLLYISGAGLMVQIVSDREKRLHPLAIIVAWLFSPLFVAYRLGLIIGSIG